VKKEYLEREPPGWGWVLHGGLMVGYTTVIEVGDTRYSLDLRCFALMRGPVCGTVEGNCMIR